jgi:hypothetical protein
MAKWFSSNCTPCRPILKSIQVTVPWLGVFGNTDGDGGTATQTAGKWPPLVAPNCNPDRYASWEVNFPFEASTAAANGRGAPPGSWDHFRVSRQIFTVDAVQANPAAPTYTQRIINTSIGAGDGTGVLVFNVESDTTTHGLPLASYQTPSAANLAVYLGVTSLMPKTTRTYNIAVRAPSSAWSGAVIPITVEFSVKYSNPVPAPIGQVLSSLSLDALKAMDWGQHSVNGVVTTFSNPATVPSYIFNQGFNALNQKSYPVNGGQGIEWAGRIIAVIFPWSDMQGCVVTAKNSPLMTATEGVLACVTDNTSCAKCWGDCAGLIEQQSIRDAIDDDGVLYLVPPADGGQQFLVVKTAPCLSSLANLTVTPPCGCCPITCQ